MQSHRFYISRDNRECRKRSRANRKTLTNSSGCVTQLVQSIGNLTNLFAQSSHFCNTAGVICDRTVGINRHRDTHRAQHTNSRNTHAVKAG